MWRIYITFLYKSNPTALSLKSLNLTQFRTAETIYPQYPTWTIPELYRPKLRGTTQYKQKTYTPIWPQYHRPYLLQIRLEFTPNKKITYRKLTEQNILKQNLIQMLCNHAFLVNIIFHVNKKVTSVSFSRHNHHQAEWNVIKKEAENKYRFGS